MRITRFKPWLILCMSAAMLLGGCAFNRTGLPEVYKVRPGDSLSVIARHYGLDWREVARWNDIRPPYTIHVGQRLSLDPFPPLDYEHMERQRQTARNTRQPMPRSTVTPMDEGRSFTISGLSEQQQQQQRQQAASAPAPSATAYGPVVPAADQAGEQATPVDHDQPPAAAPTTTTAATTAAAATTTAPEPTLINDAGWRWPLADSVLEVNAAESARHGINLYGVAGAPVYAARQGEVVYSGAGLQGIGQLVIIKHADEYLSAYGYVQDVQVQEGDRIAAGQHIADMGVGPGSRAELHFEIRHEGEPINPRSVLPEL